jgi:hypothetical protein
MADLVDVGDIKTAGQQGSGDKTTTEGVVGRAVPVYIKEANSMDEAGSGR